MNIFEESLDHYLTKDQISKIQSVKIGIGGAGGLGSNLAVILTRCGFKDFEIIDRDTVEASNLNRQFYFLNEIGKPKTETIKERLLQINPNIKITSHRIEWTKQNADSFFNGCFIIAEAFDTAIEKSKFAEYYASKDRTVVSGVGMAGISSPKEMRIKKMSGIFLVGDMSSDSASGLPLLAPRVTKCAAMMAEVILELCLQKQ